MGFKCTRFGLGGIGGWISDCNGAILHKFSGPIRVHTSMEAELGVVLHMAETLSQKGWSSKKIVICTDSMEAIDLIKTHSYLCSNLLKGRKSLKELFNTNVVLIYVPRSCNMDADSLAKAGLTRSNLMDYWADGWLSPGHV